MTHPPPPRVNVPLTLATALALLLHVALFGVGKIWDPTQAQQKPRQKVIVQTIRLNPTQAVVAQEETIAVEQRVPQISPDGPVALVEPRQQPQEKVGELESPPPPPPPVAKVEKAPPPPPKPRPEEKKPTPKPKPVPEKKPEPKKVPEQKPAPEKKPDPKKATPKKQEPPAPPKPKPPKPNEEAKAKQEQLAAEKQRQEEAAAKKKQEKEAAEKKQQQERAAAEKKKQQEIAAAKEAARQKEEGALLKAKESLAKMNQTRDKMSATSASMTSLATAPTPTPIGSLHVDALVTTSDGGATSSWSASEMRYSDEVAYRLKSSLRLPDYGAVTIKLTLDRSGKVVRCETVKSESAKNRAYVEEKVPSIHFSPLGSHFQGAPQATFSITLKNN